MGEGKRGGVTRKCVTIVYVHVTGLRSMCCVCVCVCMCVCVCVCVVGLSMYTRVSVCVRRACVCILASSIQSTQTGNSALTSFS